jgi:hypothetical protein
MLDLTDAEQLIVSGGGIINNPGVSDDGAPPSEETPFGGETPTPGDIQ